MINIMNPPADWSTLKKLIWLRGTPINGGEELTVSGTPPISLPNSLGKPLKAWSVDLSPYQEGTGDPSPDNVRAIHGTDKLTITTAGKNLCPDLLYQASTQAIYLGQDNNIDFPLSLVGGQQYTLSYETTNSHQINVYLREEHDSGGTVIGTDSPVSFAPPTTGKYRIALHIVAGLSVDEVSHVQLELGSTASDYTPYVTPSQTVITLPQTVYTGTIGSEGGESRWGEVDLGTVSWTYRPSLQSFSFYPQLAPQAPADYLTVPKIMCEQYKPVSISTSTSGDYCCTVGREQYYQGNIIVKDTRYTDVTLFKNAMSGVKLVYELATPTTFAVPSVTIPTPSGTATTWATAEDGTVDGMEVTYVGKA